MMSIYKIMADRILKFKEVIFFCVLIALFLAVSIFSLSYGNEIRALISFSNSLSIAVYLLFLIISEVVTPVASLPILPLAVSVWGSFWAAIITLLGWFAGAVISFWVARRFGKPLVGRIIDINRLEQLSRFVPEKNLFWVVVFLRIIFPTDIFSYVLGLFTNVSFRAYFWGTLIGITPFSFIFSYGVRLPIQYQVTIAFAVLLVTILFYNRSRRKILEWIKSGLKKIGR